MPDIVEAPFILAILVLLPFLIAGLILVVYMGRGKPKPRINSTWHCDDPSCTLCAGEVKR